VLQLGAATQLSISPAWLLLLGGTAAVGLWAIHEGREHHAAPAPCCPRPVPQIVPADMCPQVLGAACCGDMGMRSWTG